MLNKVLGGGGVGLRGRLLLASAGDYDLPGSHDFNLRNIELRVSHPRAIADFHFINDP